MHGLRNFSLLLFVNHCTGAFHPNDPLSIFTRPSFNRVPSHNRAPSHDNSISLRNPSETKNKYVSNDYWPPLISNQHPLDALSETKKIVQQLKKSNAALLSHKDLTAHIIFIQFCYALHDHEQQQLNNRDQIFKSNHMPIQIKMIWWKACQTIPFMHFLYESTDQSLRFRDETQMYNQLWQQEIKPLLTQTSKRNQQGNAVFREIRSPNRALLGFLVYSNNTLFIHLRGTADWLDGILNISFFPFEIPIVTQDDSSKSTDIKKVSVHLGMLLAASRVLPEVIHHISELLDDQQKVEQLVFSGHSLGASAACLSALSCNTVLNHAEGLDVISKQWLRPLQNHLNLFANNNTKSAFQKFCHKLETVKQKLASKPHKLKISFNGFGMPEPIFNTETRELFKQLEIEFYVHIDPEDRIASLSRFIGCGNPNNKESTTPPSLKAIFDTFAYPKNWTKCVDEHHQLTSILNSLGTLKHPLESAG